MDNEKTFEYETSYESTFDLTVFDELLQRDLSEDTKALIIAQRELYRQNEKLRETLYERTTQLVMGMDYTLRFHENAQKVNVENASKLFEAVNILNDNFVEGSENTNAFRTTLLEKLESGSNESNDLSEVKSTLVEIADNTYKSSAEKELEVGASLAIYIAIAIVLPCVLVGRVVWWFWRNALDTII